MNYVISSYSVLAAIKFGLDRGEVAVNFDSLLGSLFILLLITTTAWLFGDHKFLLPYKGPTLLILCSRPYKFCLQP